MYKFFMENKSENSPLCVPCFPILFERKFFYLYGYAGFLAKVNSMNKLII